MFSGARQATMRPHHIMFFLMFFLRRLRSLRLLRSAAPLEFAKESTVSRAISRVAPWVVSAVLFAGAAGAQTESGQQQKPRGHMPDLGRHTQLDDKVPPFDFDMYFIGA